MPATASRSTERTSSRPWTLQSDTDLDFEAVELNLVLKQLERNSRISVVFLDACRDNPLASALAATSRSVEVGTRPCANRQGSRHDDRVLDPTRQRGAGWRGP